jgi:glutamate-ammonia-ligase adenylyltransferase
MAELCQAISKSEFISELLSHHPGLVEGVAMSGGACPTGDVWENNGNRLMERVKDFEEKLEWVRRLKNERILQLALLDLRSGGNHALIERELSLVADFAVRHTYEAIREHLGLQSNWPLAILGLGRFGSREMSYLSDLDLVFVYDPGDGEPADAVPGDAIRLIQRLMRLLSTPLHDGPGYAVDARLRPTGNYGPLVVTKSSWLNYFRNQADIWEIQALLRIRYVAGDKRLGKWIEETAREICYSDRGAESVWPRLCHLRKRMQLERSGERPYVADIKLGVGGLTDIEFLVQGHLLLLGSGDSSLRNGSVREVLPHVLERISTGDPPGQEILDAFQALRALEHRLRLYTNQSTALVDASIFNSLTESGMWAQEGSLRAVYTWEDILRLRRRVRSLLQSFCIDL